MPAKLVQATRPTPHCLEFCIIRRPSFRVIQYLVGYIERFRRCNAILGSFSSSCLLVWMVQEYQSTVALPDLVAASIFSYVEGVIVRLRCRTLDRQLRQFANRCGEELLDIDRP